MKKWLYSLVGMTFFVVPFLSFGAQQKKSCHLYLASSQENPVPFTEGSGENHRYLSFVRDMKSLGVEFSSLSKEVVLREFQELSRQNLSSMINNYKAWLSENGRVVQEDFHFSEDGFLLSRNQPALPEGFRNKVLPTHRESFVKEEKYKTIWSTVTDGFDGVLFQLESFETAESERLYAIPHQGVARLHLVRDFDLTWSYVLPLAGAKHGSYQALDFRFLSFVRVFAGSLFEKFFNDLKGHGAGLLNNEENLFDAKIFFDLLNLNSRAQGFKVLRSWTPQFRHLLLSPRDGAFLLSFIKAQERVFDALVMDNISSLSMVVSGRLGPKDYVVDLGADSYSPPEPTPLHGLKVNPRSYGLPNFSGDGPFVPTGPNIK